MSDSPRPRSLLVDGVPHLHCDRRLGATVRHDGRVERTRFEVWAPRAPRVELLIEPEGIWSLEALGDGYHAIELDGLGPGTRYLYRLDAGPPLPDPASGWQPDGVHGASAVVDTARWDRTGSDATAFCWSDHAWRGRTLSETVIYEMHIGTFTPEGTFDAAAGHLDRLVALGVTVVELMPVGAFPGARNWGYDAVFPFAVHHTYGGPEALARFVDAAHRAGIAVILDVVYNHFGPEGNVTAAYGPYVTDLTRTPWGDALNVMGPGSDGVRRFVLENIWRWVTEFHLDGFRLDAVHAVIDTTAVSIWEQVAMVAHAAGRAQGREILVIAESSDNDPRYLRTPERGGLGHDAVWNDDLHHCLRVAVTGERRGYYEDYTGSAEELADILTHRWRFRGRWSSFRGRHHGRPADDLAPQRFVVFSQNHDHLGNRPAGDRPDGSVSPQDRRLLAQIVLTSPFTPLLFMGEEYGERAPFPFFVDHGDPEVLEATRRGRRAEFPETFGEADVPDPAADATFRSAILDPSVIDREPHRSLHAMYTELLRLRRVTPALADPATRRTLRREAELLDVRAWLPNGLGSRVLINLGSEPASVDVDDQETIAFHGTDTAWGGPGASYPSGGTLGVPGRCVVVLTAGR